jgi:hypothetical protein
VRDHQSTLEISRFMGHPKVTTTLTIYSYLFPSDHSRSMAALDQDPLAEIGARVALGRRVQQFTGEGAQARPLDQAAQRLF